MALARTDVSSTSFNGATSVTSASFTPANSSLLVVIGSLQSTSYASIAIAGGSLTYTLNVSSVVSTDGFGHREFIWTAPVTTGASMTVTISGLAAAAEGVMDIFYYTGYSAVGGTASGAQSSSGSPFNITLSQTPISSSDVIGGCSGDTSGGASIIGVGSGFTTRFHTNDTNNVDSFSESRTSSTSTTVGWTSTSAGVLVAAAIEVQAAVSSVGPQPHFIFTPGRGPSKGLRGQLNTQTVTTVQGPFNQYYWPNPVYPKQIDQFWANDLLPLLFTGSRPHPNYDWPNPPRVTWYQHWQQGPQQSRPVTFNNLDWPNPPPVQWYREWSGVNAMRMAQQPASFFNNQDWPNPPPVIWYRSFEGDNARRMSQQPASFLNNQDWPNPPPVQWYREFSLNLLQTTLRPAQQNPVVQTDWPVPPPVTWYRDYNFSNIEVISNQPASYFNNQDWPNPPPVKWYKDYSFSNLQVIANQPASYFNNQDWPNPPPVSWYRDFFSALVQQMPVQHPFNQYSWPNPPGIPPIDEFWFNNLVNLLSQANPVPFNQLDWPVPKSPPVLDQFWAQTLALLLPTPPVPPTQDLGGKTWTREEWTKKLTQYVQQQQHLREHFSKLGQLSGEARRK